MLMQEWLNVLNIKRIFVMMKIIRLWYNAQYLQNAANSQYMVTYASMQYYIHINMTLKYRRAPSFTTRLCKHTHMTHTIGRRRCLYMINNG
uniref:Uncharacterized protein n=1 Tax=Rhizophora mucronata TaxID=61149 RepID=A0A2P2PCG8_RHIMU